MATAAYDVYAEQLYTAREGLALYEPDPGGQYDRVRVGDVGFLQEGFFNRMFNIFVDKEDPTNQGSVPENFSPIPAVYQATLPVPRLALMCSMACRVHRDLLIKGRHPTEEGSGTTTDR